MIAKIAANKPIIFLFVFLSLNIIKPIKAEHKMTETFVIARTVESVHPVEPVSYTHLTLPTKA